MVGTSGATTEPPKDTRPATLPADRLGWAACAATGCAFLGLLISWLAGGWTVSLPWAPTLGLRLAFSLDGLGALYSLLATGIGALVFAYGTSYLSLHLEHEHRPATERWRFWPWMALFALAMVGLATAQDLILLFVFFDVTAVCSYFLIGFDRDRREARTAALMALLVTIVSAVAMLVGAVLLYATYGTFSIPDLVARAGSGTTTTVAARCWPWRRWRRALRCRCISGCPGRWPRRPRCRRTCTRPRWSRPACSSSAGCTRCWPAATWC